ncbi:MAG: histidine phosphatase family protein [Pseudomonadota bacterium]
MTRTIILVRHAEKAPAGGKDPALSPAGEARAQALAAALAGASVTTIFTSPYQRTQRTAQPLASAMGITPQVVDAAVPAVVSALKASAGEGVVLVVGHSNTVPGIIAALGGPVLAELPEESFNQLFVLLPGSPPRLVQALYGAASP